MFSLRRECDNENLLKKQNPTVVPADGQNNNGTADQHGNTETTDQQRNQVILPKPLSDHIRNIPVDDESPVTFSTFLFVCAENMPDVGLYFNIKLFLVYVCIFPFTFN